MRKKYKLYHFPSKQMVEWEHIGIEITKIPTCDSHEANPPVPHFHMDSLFRKFESEGAVFLESTGLRYKDGSEIYEGDIVKRMCLDPMCNMQHTGAVIYDEIWGLWKIKEKNKSMPDGFYYAPLACGAGKEGGILGIEKLGDVFTNPELIK